MTNGKLATDQNAAAMKILEMARRMIREAANGDEEIEFRIRRYVRIRLEHDERGKPVERKMLKLRKLAEQRGLCADCKKPMTIEEEPHLHRIIQSKKYTPENTELVHSACHRRQQKAKGYQ